MGIEDKLPPYTEDTSDQKSPPIEPPDEDGTHTIWLTFTGDSAVYGPTMILLTSSSSFLDFQIKIKQRYLETRSIAADRIAFIWSTSLIEAPSSVSDYDSRRDAANGIYLDERNGESLKPTILNLPRPESMSEKLKKKKLQRNIDAVSSAAEAGVARLIVTFCDVDWTQRRSAKDPEVFERQQKAHKRNERAFLLQGRHCPPPRTSTCVVM